MNCENCGATIRIPTRALPDNGTLVRTDKLKEMQARIEQLEADYAIFKLCKDLELTPSDLFQRIEKLKTRLAAAEEVLRFYRDGGDGTRPWVASVMADGGRNARAYFASYGEQGDKP
jgi:hypothetical protein